MGVGYLVNRFERENGTSVPSPRPLPELLPRRLARGLGARSRSRVNAKVQTLLTAGVKGHVWLEADWRVIQPTDPNTLSAAWVSGIVADLDWAKSLGLVSPIRLFAGYQAPDWVRALSGGTAPGGGMIWYTNEGGDGVNYPPSDPSGEWSRTLRPVPVFWDTGYKDAYERLIRLISEEPRIVEHTAFAGLSMSAPTTVYAEPCIMQFVVLENRQVALANGYTKDLHLEAWRHAFEAHNRWLSPKRHATYTSYNQLQVAEPPSEAFPNGRMKTDEAATFALMDDNVRILKRMAVMENNSWQVPTVKHPRVYERLWAMRAANPASPVHLQTETQAKTELAWDREVDTKTVSPQLQVNIAVGKGVGSVEIFAGAENDNFVTPGGTKRWSGLSLAEAVTFNSQLAANNVGLFDDDTGTPPPPPPPPEPLRLAKGQFAWADPAVFTQVQLQDMIAPAYVAGLAVTITWDKVTTDGVTFTWEHLDKAAAAADAIDKPWMVSVQFGAQAAGLPAYVMTGLPADEVITTDGATFPAFWSSSANTKAKVLRQAIADRYRTDPLLAQFHATSFWSRWDEPTSFGGGTPGTTEWTNKWNVNHSYLGETGTGYEAVQRAYQLHEKALADEVAAAFPPHVSFAFTAGNSFSDVDTTKGEADPLRHPSRYATWSAIRTKHGARTVFANNSKNDLTGVDGYSAWLAASFGPDGAKPGRIGGRPRFHVTTGTTRFSTAQFDAMLKGEATRKNSWVTIHSSDVNAAVSGSTSAGLAIRASMGKYKANWYPDPPPTGGDPDPVLPLRLARGQFAWTNSSTQTQTQIEDMITPDYIAGVSAFVRWDQLTTDGVTFDWTVFDKVAAAAAAKSKKWAGMVIHGGVGDGLPAYVTAGLPADEIITADGATFAAFWSTAANERARALRLAIADRYKTDPNLVQWRVTTHWSSHGEPWFMGGSAGKTHWTAQWDVNHSYLGETGTGFTALQRAYQLHEKAVWDEFAELWPGHISLSQAAGDAFSDVVGSLPDTDPLKHPDRFATWSAIRTTHGERAVYQFNGKDGGAGASGYGVWLPAAFGPVGAKPGRIGGQPVGGVTSGAFPMTKETFRTMLANETTRKNSFFEVYGSDVKAAVAGVTAEDLHIRETLQINKDKWHPTAETPPPATGWLSGAGDDTASNTANGGFGTWRGERADYARMWADASLTAMINMDMMFPYKTANWAGRLDIACGGPRDGHTWASAATGSMDTIWRGQCQKIHDNWWSNLIGVDLSMAHELNGTWYPWSLTSSNVAQFKTAWQRWYGIVKTELKDKGRNVRVCLSWNSDNQVVPMATAWPGSAYVDIVGCDFYNMWPSLFTPADWDAHKNDRKADGSPRGIQAWFDYARTEVAKPITFPEWGVNPQTLQDNNWFCGKMREIFAANAPADKYNPGPGKVAGDAYFNTWSTCRLWPSTNAPMAAANYAAQKWGQVDSPPPTVRTLRGILPWLALAPMAEADVRTTAKFFALPAYMGGASAFIKWDQITTDGVTFNTTKLVRFLDGVADAGKTAVILVSHGVTGDGLPAYALSGLPANEIWPDPGGFEARPVWWSPTAQARSNALHDAVAAAIKDHPALAQIRVVGLWGHHGEPWGLESNLAGWAAKFGGTIAELQAAYAVYEKGLWDQFAARYPSHVAMCGATGPAHADEDISKLHSDPLRHPQRWDIWQSVRTKWGVRVAVQSNGAGRPGDDSTAAEGFNGYNGWIAACFSPVGLKPVRRTGAQPAGGVTTGSTYPVTIEGFRESLRVSSVDQRCSYYEMYQGDAGAAINGGTATGLALRDACVTYKDTWAP